MTLFAQDKYKNELQKLISTGQYYKIINQYTRNTGEYSSASLYYVALAYYMLEDNHNCLKYINLSNAKNPYNAGSYYIKGQVFSYLKKYYDAAQSFQVAVNLKPGNPAFQTGLGNAYYSLGKLDLALGAYHKATAQLDCKGHAFTMIAQIYHDQKDLDKALEAIYVAKTMNDSTASSYPNILYNVGLFESLKGNYDKAERQFIELLKLDSTDYRACAKLIQIYRRNKQYEKEALYREKLYEAHRQNKLDGDVREMFCFDQFNWNNRSVQVFELFRHDSVKASKTYIFQVLDQDDKIEYLVQTEYSLLPKPGDRNNYIVCITKGDYRATYNMPFAAGFNYDELKDSIMRILDQKIKPVASSAQRN